MRYLSRHTLARGAVFGGIMALAAGFAPAAAASPSVPCSTTALASAISGAASGETLVLASGCTYQVSDALPGIAANLTIDGREATLDGDGRESAGYSLLGVPAGVTLHVRNLNFTCSGNYVEQCGQAIGSSGNVTIDGGTFYDLGPTYNEYGLTDGGAISNGGQLTVIGATFDDNFTEGSGGAISNNGQLAVIATRFSHNGARSMYGSGGAIYNNGTLTVASSTFSGNTGEGGAISNDGQATLRQDTLSGNSTFFAFTSGGAIYNTGTLTVASTALNNNVASYTGGAIYSYGQATLRQDTMSGNSASDGGAIYNVSALTASSTAITGNTAAAGSPGGIDNAGGAVSLHRDHIGSNTPFNCTNVPGCTG
jgi:predicted outer membrane repeat protein